MHRCALVANQRRGRTHVVGECEMYKEERDVLGDEENRRMNVTWRDLVH